MNCDLAFDLLTRGPIPAGDPGTDAALDRHLAACHDCRRLAEAMRPAVGLLHEVLLDEEHSLPCYRGSLPAVLDVATERVAVAPRPVPQTVRAPKPREQRPWVLVATGVCLVLLGALVAYRFESPDAHGLATERPTTGLQLVGDTAKQRFVALGVEEGCRPAVTVEAADQHVFQCCSMCHGAQQKESHPSVDPATLANSCIVCHTATTEASKSDAVRFAAVLSTLL